MKIEISKDIKSPIYKQIVNCIVNQIETGQLKSGDKLPGERSLSEKLKVSRGTVTKAYSELANMEFITLVKGKGCFVTNEKQNISLGRKEKAVLMIKNTVNGLTDLGFSLSEIRIFSEIVLMERERNYSTIKIGVIDCNKEALHAVQCQIGTIKDITVNKYLLEEIDNRPIQSEILDNDLLVTTYRHYDDVLEIIPELNDKLLRVAMSPSKKTLIEIGGVAENRKVGLIYDSDTFLGVMKRELKNLKFEVNEEIAFKITGYDKESVGKFLKDKSVIILPPLTFFDTAFRRFLMMKLDGKQTIEFNYMMERGNLLYLEEKIRKLMVQK